MDKIILNMQLRETAGTNASKKLRQSDIVPAVVYKQGQKTFPIQIKLTELIHALHTSAGENAILTLQFAGKKSDTKTAIIKEIQYHPINESILHVDFQEILLTEKITVNVPIVLRGEAVGVKTDGGVLEHITKELEIECLPTQIPEKIELNVEAMKIGDIIHVKELAISPEITVVTDPEQAAVSVAAPQAEEEPQAEEGLEAEAQEPEVISEKEAEERQSKAEQEKAEKGGDKKEEQQETKKEEKGK